MNDAQNALRTPDTRTGGQRRTQRHPVATVAGVIGEILVLCAIVCALYVAWQLWWTGVESTKSQNDTLSEASWSAPASASDGSYTIAPEQSPDTAPASTTTPAEGSLIGQIYIPRFVSAWSRTIVQGTQLRELNTGGLGHYTETGMPGALGNFAIAGHRAGYGDPLGDIDKLQAGDAIIVRTEDYWYVYEFTSSELVLPNQVEVLYPVPHDASATPTQRLITMTTCHPRLQNPTHRWIAYGELKYWAKVSDGIPQELADAAQSSQGTLFTRTGSGNAQVTASSLPSPSRMCIALLLAYAAVWLSAAIAWQWPDIRRRRQSSDYKSFSLCGWYVRLQPGVLPVRACLAVLLAAAAVAAMFAWVFPWAALNIPYLQLASNYVAVQ